MIWRISKNQINAIIWNCLRQFPCIAGDDTIELVRADGIHAKRLTTRFTRAAGHLNQRGVLRFPNARHLRRNSRVGCNLPCPHGHSSTKETEEQFSLPFASKGCKISRPRSRAKTTHCIGAFKPEVQPGSRSHVISTLVAAGPTPIRMLRPPLGAGWNVCHNSAMTGRRSADCVEPTVLCASRPLVSPHDFSVLTNFPIKQLFFATARVS